MFLDFPENVAIVKQAKPASLDVIHAFAFSFNELEKYFKELKPLLKKTGSLWISWPKKSSEIKSELDKMIVMNYGLNHGLVDVKVASVNKDWSALKFVYRLKDR